MAKRIEMMSREIQRRKRPAKRRAGHVVTRERRARKDLPIPIRRLYTRVNKKPDKCGNHLRLVNGEKRGREREKKDSLGAFRGRTTKTTLTRSSDKKESRKVG